MEKIITAIVLNTVDYKENDKMLTVLTPDGKRNAVMRGVKKKDAKLKAFAQPFCFAEYTLSVKGLPIVTGAAMKDAFYEIAYDPDKYFRATAMLELSDRWTEYDTSCEQVFLCLLQALRTLAYTDARPDTVLSLFLLKGLEAVGYAQQFDRCVLCGEKSAEPCISLRQGGLVCASCADGRRVDQATVEALRALQNSDWDMLVGMRGAEVDRLLWKECERMMGFRLRSVEYL